MCQTPLPIYEELRRNVSPYQVLALKCPIRGMVVEWNALEINDTATTYCGPAPTPGNLLSSWNMDPLVLAALTLLGLFLWRSHARNSGQAATIGWIALFVAFVSPLCALTAGLFLARAFHHIIIVTVAAPALAMALPILRVGTIGIWLAILSAVMVAWHVPAVYSWIWQSDLAYWGMQIAMLGSAWAFWSLALSSQPDQILYNALGIAGLAGIMGFLGAILTFAPAILYFEHVGGAALWGLEPLTDQQLAGLVMWVPGFVPLAALAAMILRRGWLREADI